MKIFRKIRQQLVLSNSIQKYLAYAVGEIILVVIGILIALSINNWRASIAKEELEMSLYGDLIEELRIDLGEIKGNREYNQHFLKRYRKGSDIILNDQDRKLVDTLALIATELTKFSDFKNESTAYQKLTVSGKIDLITDNEVLNDLQNLGILYIYINRIEQNQSDFMYTVVPKITSSIRFNPFEVMKPDQLYDYEFQNSIELIIQIGFEKDDLYKQAESVLNELIEKLENKRQ